MDYTEFRQKLHEIFPEWEPISAPFMKVQKLVDSELSSLRKENEILKLRLEIADAVKAFENATTADLRDKREKKITRLENQLKSL